MSLTDVPAFCANRIWMIDDGRAASGVGLKAILLTPHHADRELLAAIRAWKNEFR